MEGGAPGGGSGPGAASTRILRDIITQSLEPLLAAAQGPSAAAPSVSLAASLATQEQPATARRAARVSFDGRSRPSLVGPHIQRVSACVRAAVE